MGINDKDYKNLEESRLVVKLMGFKSDKDAMDFFGLHKFYLRNRTIIPISKKDFDEEEDYEPGVDVQPHIIKMFRMGLKFHCLTNGYLDFAMRKIPDNLEYEDVVKFIKKFDYTEEKIREIGRFTRRNYKWAYRYVELEDKTIHVNVKDLRPALVSADLKDYLAKIGMSTYKFSMITKIPYPSLSKKDYNLAYHRKLAELMYKYFMYYGRTMDVDARYDLDFVDIFWREKADLMRKKEELWGKIQGKPQRIKQFKEREDVTKSEIEIEVKKIESETEQWKEEMKEIDDQLIFTFQDLENTENIEKITVDDICAYAECEPKRVIWRHRLLPWSICFARLLRLSLNSSVLEKIKVIPKQQTSESISFEY